MKISRYKQLIIGTVFGFTLATSTGALAAVNDKVEAIFAEFNFIINGKPVTLDETPLVYNGTSYLPVRSLSNALGMDVTYKSDSRTIEINNTSVTDNVYAKKDVLNIPNAVPSDELDNISQIELAQKYGLTAIVDNSKNSLILSNDNVTLIVKLYDSNGNIIKEGFKGNVDSNHGEIWINYKEQQIKFHKGDLIKLDLIPSAQ